MSFLTDDDLELLTDRQLFEVSQSLGLVYKGRNNAINELALKPVPDIKQLKNLVVYKRKLLGVPSPYYKLSDLLIMDDSVLNTFRTYFEYPDASRCDIIRILTYGSRLFEADMILTSHPNFDDVCVKISGPDYNAKLQNLARELQLDPSVYKNNNVLLLKVLNLIPIQEATDINWVTILNQVLENPKILEDTFQYFGKLGLFNQLYLYNQFNLEGKTIEPVDTNINWKKMGADISSAQIPYTIIVPNGRNFIYSPSVFGYSQTSLASTSIQFPSWACDITKLYTSDLEFNSLTKFDRDEFMKMARGYLSPAYQEYADSVYRLVAWCFGSLPDSKAYKRVPNSEVAINVIQAASDILRIGKFETYITYP